MPPDDVSYLASAEILENFEVLAYSKRRIVSVSWITDGSSRRMAGAEPEQVAVPLDDVDRKIIAELTRDGRMSVTQVAENVHISRAHAYTRIARLTGEGVLTKFTALVDPIKAGLKSSAYVTLKVRQHSWRELRELLRAIPEVHHIALVGGDFDVILLVRAVDNVDLRRVIFDQLQSMPGVLDTQTFLVFEDVDTR
jgi:DNA-binding Lrp family transcriptional regulator